MSGTGFYSGLYDQIREYAELVDDVIIGIKGDTSSPSDPSRKKLMAFLKNLAADHWENLSTRLISLVIRNGSGVSQTEWSQVGNALSLSEVDDAVVERLEDLARFLEREQIGAMAGMKGWVH
jgi:hypothetical protein